VVDLGAGTGLLALEARRRVKGSGYVVAVDVSADALSECRRQWVSAENVAPLACVVGDALKPKGRASIFEPINEVSEQVRNRVIASAFYDQLQPEWGEIRKYYDAHAKDWWGTLVGWDERELIGWLEAAGFSSVKVSYELMAGIRAPKPKKPDIAAGIRGRPNPNMPSYEEVARQVLGDRADSYLERYAQFLVNCEGPRSASAAVYLVAKR
jgi:SAM-dependent methyltransferase